MKFFCLLMYLLVISVWGVCESSDPPDWAKTNTQYRDGNYCYIVCSGEGPDSSIARNIALNDCRTSAISYLQTSAKMSAVTIETEKGSSYHQEIIENITFTGLRCEPIKDKVLEEKGYVKIWIMCKFNLKEAKAVSAQEVKEENVNVVSSGHQELVKNKTQLETIKTQNVHSKVGSMLVGTSKRTISIGVVPQCDDILIQGKKTRTVKCVSNPLPIVLYEEDSNLIIRAKGYQPQKIELGTGKKMSDSINIILTPM